MLLKTTTASCLFTLSIIICAFGVYCYYGLINYFIIIPGWHIQVNFTNLYIGCAVMCIVNILLYKKLAKRSPTVKVCKFIQHVLLTVPFWMVCVFLQSYVILHQFNRHINEGQLPNYYFNSNYISIALLIVVQLYFWINIFKNHA